MCNTIQQSLQPVSAAVVICYRCYCCPAYEPEVGTALSLRVNNAAAAAAAVIVAAAISPRRSRTTRSHHHSPLQQRLLRQYVLAGNGLIVCNA